MSDYVQIVAYGPKDALTTGDPAKLIKGTEIDAEFDAIATAISSKEDQSNKGQPNGYAGLDGNGDVPSAQLPAGSSSAAGILELATNAETVTGTDTARAVTPAGVEAWAAQNAGMVQDISNLSDPNADRILFWDDSAGAVVAMSVTSPVTITGTALSVDAADTNSAGIIEIATTAEALVGTDNTRAVSPACLGTIHPFDRKSGDTSRSSTDVPTADPHLSVAVEAGAIYDVEVMLFASGTAGDLRVGWTEMFAAELPDSTFDVLCFSTTQVDATAGPSITADNEASGADIILFGSTTPVLFKGRLVVGTAGNFCVYWSQVTSSGSATTLEANSYIKLKKIG